MPWGNEGTAWVSSTRSGSAAARRRRERQGAHPEHKHEAAQDGSERAAPSLSSVHESASLFRLVPPASAPCGVGS